MALAAWLHKQRWTGYLVLTVVFADTTVVNIIEQPSGIKIASIFIVSIVITSLISHAYFGWREGNPISYLMKFLAFGEGDTAPVTREVLRQTEPSPLRRPRIHVG